MKERLCMWYAILILQSVYHNLTHYNLNHHAAIRTGKARCTSGIDNLRNKSTTQLSKVKASSRRQKTYETKNIDTPIVPRSRNTPDAGKIIIPSRDHVR